MGKDGVFTEAVRAWLSEHPPGVRDIMEDTLEWMGARRAAPPSIAPPVQIAMWAFEQARAILPPHAPLEDVREAVGAILHDVLEFALAATPPKEKP